MVIANNLGLMAKLQTTDGTNLWTSPTANLSFDLVLSFCIIVMAHIEGIRRRGIKQYLKGFVTPAFMTPMNLLEEVTNFLSLALRIFGNIFAGEVMTSLLLVLSHQAIFLVSNRIWDKLSLDCIFRVILCAALCLYTIILYVPRK